MMRPATCCGSDTAAKRAKVSSTFLGKAFCKPIVSIVGHPTMLWLLSMTSHYLLDDDNDAPLPHTRN